MLPTTALPSPCPDREPVLFGQTKTLGSGPGLIAAHADASSPVARTQLQLVTLETSPPFPKDVNRAIIDLGVDTAVETSEDVIPSLGEWGVRNLFPVLSQRPWPKQHIWTDMSCWGLLRAG